MRDVLGEAGNLAARRIKELVWLEGAGGARRASDTGGLGAWTKAVVHLQAVGSSA